MTTSLASTKPAIRSRGAVGSAVVILAMAAKLIAGVEIDDGLQLALVENVEEWVVLIAGTVALIGRLQAAARITRLW